MAIMKRVEQALSSFRQPYNCAQTICAAFGREDLLEEMKLCGGGRAPEGTCGALYGAMQVAPERAESLRAAFCAATGAFQCSHLKGELRVPCQTCVKTAAELLVQGANEDEA